MTVKYLGNLRTESTHLESQQKIITDAPKDNQGNGEYFSPTDLCTSSLASCMLTIMGILAKRENINMEKMEAQVEKVMGLSPRKIAEVKITFNWKDSSEYSHDQKEKLKRAALSCPVSLSLGEDVKQNVLFNF